MDLVKRLPVYSARRLDKNNGLSGILRCCRLFIASFCTFWPYEEISISLPLNSIIYTKFIIYIYFISRSLAMILPCSFLTNRTIPIFWLSGSRTTKSFRGLKVLYYTNSLYPVHRKNIVLSAVPCRWYWSYWPYLDCRCGENIGTLSNVAL